MDHSSMGLQSCRSVIRNLEVFSSVFFIMLRFTCIHVNEHENQAFATDQGKPDIAL